MWVGARLYFSIWLSLTCKFCCLLSDFQIDYLNAFLKADCSLILGIPSGSKMQPSYDGQTLKGDNIKIAKQLRVISYNLSESASGNQWFAVY